MSSKVEIWNMALRTIGISNTIADENERSAEADACRDLWDDTRRAVLADDFPWPFALRRVSLAQVALNPTDFWGVAYRYPPEALAVRRVASPYRPDTSQTRIDFDVAGDDNGQLIYSNESPATIEYTMDVEDPEFFPPGFVTALRYRLAAELAPSLTSGDQFKLGDKAMQKYLWLINRAKLTAAHESAPSPQPTSELERAREG